MLFLAVAALHFQVSRLHPDIVCPIDPVAGLFCGAARLNSYDASLFCCDASLNPYDVSLFCCDASLNPHDASLFCYDASLNPHDVSLFCYDASLNPHDASLFCCNASLNPYDASLFCYDVSLFCYDYFSHNAFFVKKRSKTSNLSTFFNYFGLICYMIYIHINTYPCDTSCCPNDLWVHKKGYNPYLLAIIRFCDRH
jgi:hypothetical protein